MDNELKTALEGYFAAIKADYYRWTTASPAEDEILQQVRNDMLKEFNEGLTFEEGQKYIRIITRSGSSRSAHSFIVKEDDGKFKKGDILKTAGWKAPAKNRARGNIFSTYHINWEGADYLR